MQQIKNATNKNNNPTADLHNYSNCIKYAYIVVKKECMSVLLYWIEYLATMQDITCISYT